MNIAPNLMTATVSIESMDTYNLQDNFSVASLQIIQSQAVKNKRSMPGAEANHTIKALISDQTAKQFHLNIGDKFDGEIQKVSGNLWRVNEVKKVHTI